MISALKAIKLMETESSYWRKRLLTPDVGCILRGIEIAKGIVVDEHKKARAERMKRDRFYLSEKRAIWARSSYDLLIRGHRLQGLRLLKKLIESGMREGKIK